MTDTIDPGEPDDETDTPEPDALAVLRARAEETRRDRDTAIAELRQTMTDQQILEEFGIDLSPIED